MVNLLSLLADIAVINECEHIFIYLFPISFFLNFQIFQETFRKLCCGNFPSFRKLSWKLPETAWKFSTLPVIKVNALKHWWSEELSELKQRSIDTFHVWKDAGKPRSGTVFDLYMQNKYAYKLCINKMKNDSAQEITNDLHEALL